MLLVAFVYWMRIEGYIYIVLSIIILDSNICRLLILCKQNNYPAVCRKTDLYAAEEL